MDGTQKGFSFAQLGIVTGLGAAGGFAGWKVSSYKQKGLDGNAMKVYHEYSIDFGRDYYAHNTTNVLLDNQGKIVAWYVSGAELQYYLWKAFGE